MRESHRPELSRALAEGVWSDGEPAPNALLRGAEIIPFPDEGGFPIAVTSSAEYEDAGVALVPGDRLLLCIGAERPAGFRPAGPASVVELERVADASEGTPFER